MRVAPSRPPAATIDATQDAVPAAQPQRGWRGIVRTGLLGCIVGFLALPDVAFPQTAFVYSERKPPMAGTAIWIAGDACDLTKDIVHLGDQQLKALRRSLYPDQLTEVARAYARPDATQPSAGATAWQVHLPRNLDAGAYSVRLPCASEPLVAVIDVQALLPLVTSAVPVDGSVVARGERIRLTIRHLDDWRRLNDDNGAAQVRLFLDGTEFANIELEPTDMRADTYDATLSVDIADDDTLATWARIIRRSDFASTVAGVGVSVGVTSGRPFPSHATLRLRVLPPYWMVGVGLFGALVIFVVCVLAVRTPLLRDSNGQENNAPFSLARHQMAFWTVVVVGSYVYIAMLTGGISAPNATALYLIGISGSTGLVAGSIDQRRRSNGDHRPLTHENWFEDLLSDDNGVSIHRLQILIWTLVLGFFYILEVYHSLAMPEFDAAQLGLLGISSGLYVGFKFPESAP